MNRTFRLILTAVITLGAFSISAVHWFDVATDAGNPWYAAVVYPIAIDALILLSALTMMATTGVNRMAKWYATIGRAFGFGATIYGNIAASHFETLNDAIINMLPAISLIIGVEMLIHGMKATVNTRARKTTKSAPRHAGRKTTTGRKLAAVNN
jgi:DNA-binding transcriptional regulator YbjK